PAQRAAPSCGATARAGRRRGSVRRAQVGACAGIAALAMLQVIEVVEERPHARGVELTAGVTHQLLAGVSHRARLTVGTCAGDRVEGVSDEQDTRRQRDRLAAEAVRVAGTVEALVCVANPGHDTVEPLDARDELGSGM